MIYNNDRYVNRYFQNTELVYGIEIYMFTLLIQTMYKSINLSIRISKSNRIWKNIFIQISENDFRNYLERLAVEFWVQLFSMFLTQFRRIFEPPEKIIMKKRHCLPKFLVQKSSVSNDSSTKKEFDALRGSDHILELEHNLCCIKFKFFNVDFITKMTAPSDFDGQVLVFF